MKLVYPMSVIGNKEGIYIDKQKLVFYGIEMEDGRSLADYSIQKESTIYLSLLTGMITLDANGGVFENGTTSIKCLVEDPVCWMDTVPLRDGYKFTTWRDEKNGGTPVGQLDPMPAGITLYAQWEENSALVPAVQEPNPNTLDAIGTTILTLIISFVGLVSSILYFKNKVKN